MAVIDDYVVNEELSIFLRNQNILTRAQREVASFSQSFTMNGTDSSVTLTNTNVKNIRSVASNAVVMTNYQNYTVHYEDHYGGTVGTISLTNTPANNVTIAVNGDYGGTDHVHPDFPRADLSMSSYPRVSVEVVDVRTTGGAIGGKAHDNDLMVSVSVFADKKQDIREYARSVRNAILTNNKSFQNFSYIKPMTGGPILKDPERKEKIEQKTDDYIIPHEWEVTT